MAGAVNPGDRSMTAGGASEGGNQDNEVVLILRKLQTGVNDRNYVFEREPALTYFILRNGELDPSHEMIRRDMCVRDFDDKRLFRPGKSVTFFGVNPHPMNIIVPVSVRLLDATSVDGTISIDFACNVSCPDKLLGMLNSDYVDKCQYGVEVQTRLTSNNLSKMIRNVIGDCGLKILSKFDKTLGVIENISVALFEILDRDLGISSKGLDVVRANIRFGESVTEKIMRLRSEGKIKMAEDEIKFEGRMLTIDLSRKEYRNIHEGD